MSNVMACVGKYAKNPYYFKKFSVRIWSIEELCYFFVSNPFILDGEILDKGLADWIEQECELKELSHMLYSLFHKANAVKLFVMTILEYVNYCTPQEQEQLEQILQENVGLNAYVKQKNKADYLAESGKYTLAMQAYDAILLELPESENSIRASIFHNKGVTCARLFMYEKAAGYFEAAYELSGQPDSLRQMLIAKRQHLSEKEYIALVGTRPEYYQASMKVEQLYKQVREQFEATQESRMLFTLRVYREDGNTTMYYEDINQQIERLKKEYMDMVE